jgi:hypothetical protein
LFDLFSLALVLFFKDGSNNFTWIFSSLLNGRLSCISIFALFEVVFLTSILF